jgi:F-box-like
VSSKYLCPLICSQTCEFIGLNTLDSNRRHSPIHILNDDVLLNIFHLYRLAEPDEYEDENGVFNVEWYRQRWWYKLAHVCRQWRNIILESPSRLDLHLFCANGVPIADMLTHSPPLPLTICYDSAEITAEDESGILLALSHRDRVGRIDLRGLPNVEKFVMAMDDQFPLLERMYISSQNEVALPVTFQAPNLRHLILWTASLPIGSPSITNTAGLVHSLASQYPNIRLFPSKLYTYPTFAYGPAGGAEHWI